VPKGTFTEDVFDLNSMITLENESYTVEKFMMVTAKLVGNIIACDDKKSVSLVDPKTMQ
jgi:ribosomal protein S17